MPLQHEHILNPITALEFCQHPDGKLLLLAGEGSFLKIFNAENLRLLSQSKGLGDQAIHGIVTTNATRDDDIQALIWGGASLAIFTRLEFEKLLDSEDDAFQRLSEAPDWILDAIISPTDPECCHLITAHNTLVRARLEISSSKIVFESESSPSRSILYSAHLMIEPSGSILVAAGTVFGEIIVWTCSTSDDVQVSFTFTGHEGSIFGVNLSPLLDFDDKRQTRLLASCSDDRTIRVWDLTPDLETRNADGKLVIARETGFGSNGDGQGQAENRCIATVMAHASRIWSVKFPTNQRRSSQSDLTLFSFGEDSTAQQWSLNVNASPASMTGAWLTHRETFAFHSGKHIWSTALHSEGPSTTVFATGGADGKISSRDIRTNPLTSSGDDEPEGPHVSAQSSDDVVLETSWDFEQDILPQIGPDQFHSIAKMVDEETSSEPIDLEVPHTDSIDGETPKKKKKKKAKKRVQDVFNKYAFVSEDQLLLTTTFGRILFAELSSTVQWTEVAVSHSISQDIKSYAVVHGMPELDLAFFAGVNGTIYAITSDSDVFEVANVGGKVADMFKVFNPNTKNIELLVTTLGSDICTMFELQTASTVALQCSAKYKLPEKFVVTSAGRIDNLVVLGSRNGSLAVYNMYTNAAHQTSDLVSAPIGDAITTIIPLPSYNVGATSYFLITRRDGMYSIHAATLSSPDSNNLRCVHVGGLPLGPMIESAWFDGGDLFLYGFKSTKFGVWNETQQLEVLNVDCGGAHRNYAYSPLNTSSGGHFAYTKASKLHIHSQKIPSHTILKRGGHGREIKACAVSPNGDFFATGAEDTTIRIWSYNDKNSILENDFRDHNIMQKHSAGIQHLQWHGSNYLISSGGNEEFFIWALERIPGYCLGVVCEAVCPDQTEDRDLRIMSFDVSDASEGKMLITLAYSDSTLRSYTYSKESGYRLVGSGRYTSACLTQIRRLAISDQEAYILTAATDGNISLWRITFETTEVILDTMLSFLGTQKVHQNTIKSLDYIKVDDSIIIVTGGDDNALGITMFSIQKFIQRPLSPQLTRYILRSAHAAAITGLCILPSADPTSEMQRMKVISSGNDQRVKEWQIQLSNNAKGELRVADVQNTSDEFTSIADVGDVAFLRSQSGSGGKKSVQKTLIVGNGMEVWNSS